MREKPKEMRIPTVGELVSAGVPTWLIPTYYGLTDYVNKDGLCWPKMETLAETLNYSVRTIRRHLHLLQDTGLIEFVVRRRIRGRFDSYIYKFDSYIYKILPVPPTRYEHPPEKAATEK